jgi:SpoVK/Ycf46/Vps4 family AAA+-type ATPase
MSKRIYIPLPDEEGRVSLINNLMQKHLDSSNQKTSCGKSMIGSFLNSFKSDEQKDKPLELSSILSVKELSDLVLLTEGYSGSDLSALCKVSFSMFLFYYV